MACTVGDIKFEPVLSEINPLVKDLKFSILYFGKHCGKNILISGHESKTVLVNLRNDTTWGVEFTTLISSRDRSIKTNSKIQGNGDLILLLDGDGNLWKLINAFEFSNEKDECLYLIDNKCFYEWVPFKKFGHCKVMEITAYQDGFACLVETKERRKFLKVFSSDNINHVQDYTFDELRCLESEKFHLLTVKNSKLIENEPQLREAILITDNENGATYILSSSGKTHIINISSSFLTAVLFFYDVKCLLLCYQNGKFLFVLLNDEFLPVKDCSVYVLQNIVSIEKCDCCETCIIWSDGFHLHHTNVQFVFEKSCFVKLSHWNVKNNIMCVKSMIKTISGIMAVTINNFYYNITVNRFVKPKEIFMSSDEILSQIFQGSLTINTLNKEIENATDYLKIKELIQAKNYQEHVELKIEQEQIILKIKVECVFRKNIWRFRQRVYFNNKYHIEFSDLETDLCEGMVVKIKTNLLKKNEIELSLIGDFGSEFDILIVPLGKIDGGKSKKEEEIEKTLCEVVKKRNPYIK